MDQALFSHPSEDIKIPKDQRILRNELYRLPMVQRDLKDAPGQPFHAFARLVGVGDAGYVHRLTRPASIADARLEQFGGIALHEDDPLEIKPGTIAPIFMGWTRVTIAATVLTALVGVHTPGEWQIRAVHLVDDRSRMRGYEPGSPITLRLLDHIHALWMDHRIRPLQKTVRYLFRGAAALDVLLVDRHAQKLAMDLP